MSMLNELNMLNELTMQWKYLKSLQKAYHDTLIMIKLKYARIGLSRFCGLAIADSYLSPCYLFA